jgi:hypothetical protein
LRARQSLHTKYLVTSGAIDPAGNTLARGLFEYFGVNSPLAAGAAQAKCAPALVKSGAVVREYSEEVEGRMAVSCGWQALNA